MAKFGKLEVVPAFSFNEGDPIIIYNQETKIKRSTTSAVEPLTPIVLPAGAEKTDSFDKRMCNQRVFIEDGQNEKFLIR